jgi:hypothetical protein
MKSGRLTLVVILCTIFGFTEAQDYAFKVLVNKGKNELKTGNHWEQLKVGLSLKSADELKISENSYLGLVHVSGKALEIKQSGSYKVVDLAKKINGGTSVLNKYTDFILSTTATSKNRLAATGAVERGTGEIEVYLPKENQIVYNDNVIIHWNAEEFPAPYEVVLYTMFDDELDRKETTSNSVSINLNDPLLSHETTIMVKVSSKTDKTKVSEKYTVKRISKSEKERIKNSLNEIANQTADETAVNKLLVASFYEQNNLVIDAGTAYQEAIQLAPDVPQLKDAYTDYLLRYHLKKPPVKK